MGERHQFRAEWLSYNYGIFFVTICSYKKRWLFGRITENMFYPSHLGVILEAEIGLLENRHKDVKLWNHVVMPNHIHMLLEIFPHCMRPVTAREEYEIRRYSITEKKHLGCLKSPLYGEPTEDFHHNTRLAVVIGALKAGVTRRYRREATQAALNPQAAIWHARFHEHFINNPEEFARIDNYISTNIENWDKDCFH